MNSCLAACISISVYNTHDVIIRSDKRSHGRIRELRVSSPALFQPAVTTPTDWAKSLRLDSFSSGWTAALFRDPDKHERLKQQSKTRNTQLNLRWRPVCNTVFMLMLLAALSTCHGNAFGAWSGKQRQRKKSWLFTDRGLVFQTAGSRTRTGDFRVSSPEL